MGSRLELQNILEGILGSNHVYFQPPSTFQMLYPCIVYERSGITTMFANNLPYFHAKKYKVTVIDFNPDSPIPDAISELPRCRFSTSFKADDLNHDVFTLIF